MTTIGIALGIVAFCTLGARREKALGYNSYGGWPSAMLAVSAIGFLVLVGIVGSASERGESSYATTVNGTTFYCERPTFEYDAGFAWPGWTVRKYDYNQANATCYPIKEQA